MLDTYGPVRILKAMLGRRYKSQVNPFGGPFLHGVNPIVPHPPVNCKSQRGRRGPSNSINCLSEGAGFSGAPDLIIPGLHVQACSSGTDADHGKDATISGFGRAATFVDGLPSLARPNPDRAHLFITLLRTPGLETAPAFMHRTGRPEVSLLLPSAGPAFSNLLLRVVRAYGQAATDGRPGRGPSDGGQMA